MSAKSKLLTQESRPMNYSEVRSFFQVIHERRISSGLVAFIGRMPGASNLCLLLRDEKSDRFILMKLKSFRKIIKWMFANGFTTEPRRLTRKEKKKVDLYTNQQKIEKEFGIIKEAITGIESQIAPLADNWTFHTREQWRKICGLKD